MRRILNLFFFLSFFTSISSFHFRLPKRRNLPEILFLSFHAIYSPKMELYSNQAASNFFFIFSPYIPLLCGIFHLQIEISYSFLINNIAFVYVLPVCQPFHRYNFFSLLFFLTLYVFFFSHVRTVFLHVSQQHHQYSHNFNYWPPFHFTTILLCKISQSQFKNCQ